MDFPGLFLGTWARITPTAGSVVNAGARKLCRCEHCIFTSRVCVHSRTLHCIETDCVRQAFSDACTDREVPNKALHRLVTTWRDIGSVCERKCVMFFWSNFCRNCTEEKGFVGFGVTGRRPAPPPQELICCVLSWLAPGEACSLATSISRLYIARLLSVGIS
jgi:hypothetical protein